jgi:aminopeptidase N
MVELIKIALLIYFTFNTKVFHYCQIFFTRAFPEKPLFYTLKYKNMKFRHSLLCLTALLTYFSIKAQAPKTFSINDIQAAEVKHYQALEGFAPTGAGADIDVTYHRFEWVIDPAKRFIKGSVTTYFKVLKPNNILSFDLDETMKVDSVKYRNNLLTFTHLNKILSITTPAIAANAFDSVTVYYGGVPPQTGFGSFVQRFRGTAAELWTLSEPYGGRDWWPGKMDLQDKIDSIDVIVTTPPQYRVASNGLLVEEYLKTAQEKVFHWKHRYPIANYLVAVAVTNYEQFSDKIALSRGDSLYVLNYAYPEENLSIQAKARKVLPIIRFYDSIIGDYPFKKEKYGQARFGWGGGQEHQTFTFLVNYSTDLMAHELAHQWFGDKITCGSWLDIWLNESFATYMTGAYTEKLEPTRWQDWKTTTIADATRTGSGSVFVDDTTSVDRIFSYQLSYQKGAYVLRMLQWKLGTSVFYKAINNYLKDPSVAYGFARTADLKRHLEAESKQDLTEFFNDWFYGQGYPTYKIDWYSSDVSKRYSIKITQAQSNAAVSFFEMPVPLRFKDANGKDTIAVFNNTLSNSKSQLFEIDLKSFATITSVEFDPDLWILSKGNTVNNTPTPTQDVDFQYNMKLSPNPVDNELTIAYKNERNESVQIELINALGQVVFNEKREAFVGENNMVLSIPTIKSGMYFLRLSSSKGQAVKKFMKM